MTKYFGPSFGRVMTAVFAYRNNMVHNGYEWDLDIRQEFRTRIETEGWSDWFLVSTTGGDPWYFTMTPSFYEECKLLCNRAVLVFEGLLYGDWERYEIQYAESTDNATT